jgi:hypothetical protein
VPSPTLATSQIYRGPGRESRLTLPSVGTDDRNLPTPDLEETPPDPRAGLPLVPKQWRITRDPVTGTAELTIGSEGKTRIDAWHVLESSSTATATVSERDPSHASMSGQQMVRYRWPVGTIEMHSRATIASDATTFHVTIDADITIDGHPHFNRRWAQSFPRMLL